MKHHSLSQWEKKLYNLIINVDHYLEEKYGNDFRRHPARPPHGQTSSVSHDGVFSVTSNFSLGLGSQHGRGYAIDIKIVTLETVDQETREAIEKDAMEKIRELLPDYFPNRELNLQRDGNVIKLYGDLSLGNI
ncbi:MAG: hypothetical protein U5R06_08530 [candidate division KSB1 bacterium]|nr:hypothetical protein [candidate division KSB1 bacterium]